MFFSFTSQEVIMPVTVCEARGSIKAHPALKKRKSRLHSEGIRLVQNCGFCIAEICLWYWNTPLSKCSYVIHHFNVHFSFYSFLLMTYYLQLILYLFLTMEMLDKKQIWVVFLFKFKMGRKAAQTTCNINNTFGLGTAKNVQCSGHSRSLAEETRALRMRSWEWEWDQKLTTTESNHRSWSSHNHARSCWRNQHRPFYCHSAFEANCKGERAW